ncbi:hypothetical protein FHS61_002095 [Altererythrobacter atlanticus]|uniref:Uncharacterized protein n=1 Tax=Croceibacterium atlanticum TaxID=1267766 RepID=A0A0F7KQZ3_9SPHN|nr:hypothetical protein [Croceibacterium atlanticum]AKH41607.1 hypothetical protein WYH_00549 [Croceibacterium atlanticum]MBB5733069.1 hypothetical protein [Croceibacterium atlanticum]
MTQLNWLSLIALLGWLILAVSAFRAQRLGAKKMVVMALAWGAIFLLVTAVITAVSP